MVQPRRRRAVELRRGAVLSARSERRAGLVIPADRVDEEEADPVAALTGLRAVRRRVEANAAADERRLVESVAAARNAGASWHEVALVLGVTAEGARKRYRERS